MVVMKMANATRHLPSHLLVLLILQKIVVKQPVAIGVMLMGSGFVSQRFVAPILARLAMENLAARA
jgi:hypothetical protein